MSATREGRVSLLCRLGFHHPIGYTTTLAYRYWTCHNCGATGGHR